MKFQKRLKQLLTPIVPKEKWTLQNQTSKTLHSYAVAAYTYVYYISGVVQPRMCNHISKKLIRCVDRTLPEYSEFPSEFVMIIDCVQKLVDDY